MLHHMTSCILCLAGVNMRLMSVSLTPVEMVVPVWIDSTCLCVNVRLDTAVQPVTLTYVCYIIFLYVVFTGQELYTCTLTLVALQHLKTSKQTSNELDS